MVWESSIFTKWKVKVYKGTEYMNEDTERYEFDYGWEKWVNKKTKRMAVFKASYAC
jgi:hypothetical protein